LDKEIKRGAEAEILEAKFRGEKAIEKHRLSKGYRCRELDEKIRSERTKSEAGLLHKAKKSGIRTPLILAVDAEKKSIFEEFIRGKNAKESIKGNAKLAGEIGKKIAVLHSNSIIHGDLTTDNILVDDGTVVFIDFGLGFYSHKDEDKAVDLINLKKTLLAGDASLKKEWKQVMKAYNSKKMERKIKEVEKRARYS